jgi:hypothetical protein
MKWLFAAVSAAVAFAAPAHCDEIGFLTDIKAAGFTADSGNGSIIEVGTGMCRALAAGATREQVAEAFFERSQLDSLDRARVFVGIAQQDLCTLPGST